MLLFPATTLRTDGGSGQARIASSRFRVPRAELHLLDSGHFALEDKGDEIARLMRDFFARTLVQEEHAE